MAAKAFAFKKPLFALVMAAVGAFSAALLVRDHEGDKAASASVGRDTPAQEGARNEENGGQRQDFLFRPFLSGGQGRYGKQEQTKLLQVNCEHFPDLLEAGHTVVADTRDEHGMAIELR